MLRPRFTTAALSLLAAGVAHAGRPLQTDDAPVMASDACELEAAHSDWRQGGRGQRQTYLQLGCGIGWETEVALQVQQPREFVLGAKTQLASSTWRDGDAQVSLAWSLAHRHVETAWRRSGAGLVLVATAPLTRDWVLHANLGHQRDELARRRSTGWALAAEHNGLGDAGRWQPMAEVFGDDRGNTWANAALRLALLPERVFIDASLGRQLGGGRARLASAGFKLAF
ncbi:MAG: hypothetical protein HY020_05115 [Burkholderiales bacterium]|nr:hypothetical protein [Burkholderiales bacterium]